MNLLLVLPIIIPMATAIATLIFSGNRTVQRGLNLGGALVLLVAACWLLWVVWQDGIQATQIGDWPAPFGITLVADLLSGILVVLSGIVAVTIAVYSLASIDVAREHHGYYSLMNMMLMGISGAFLTGDIFNLFVWFEVLLMSSFVLMALGGERAQLEGAIKYVTLNLMSSALFLAAVGILYGLAGTLNMADLARRVGGQGGEHAVVSISLSNTLAMMFLVAFGIKAAIFPLFAWLPASYHTPPFPVSAIFVGLLTKVGVYALLRVFTLIFVRDIPFTHTIILVAAGLTMIVGVLGAIAQAELRRIFSFAHISQIGYMLIGLGLFTPLALAGSVFYIMHHVIVKTNLFLISGVLQRMYGSNDLRKLGGVYRSFPLLSLLFLIPALSLAGVPPLSGFWAKLILIRVGLDLQSYGIVLVALVVSLLTLFVVGRIWAVAFWKPAPSASTVQPLRQPERWLLLGPITALALMTLTIGLAAGPVFELAQRAAEQLADPSAYVRAVLGESR